MTLCLKAFDLSRIMQVETPSYQHQTLLHGNEDKKKIITLGEPRNAATHIVIF